MWCKDKRKFKFFIRKKKFGNRKKEIELDFFEKEKEKKNRDVCCQTDMISMSSLLSVAESS